MEMMCLFLLFEKFICILHYVVDTCKGQIVSMKFCTMSAKMIFIDKTNSNLEIYLTCLSIDLLESFKDFCMHK